MMPAVSLPVITPRAPAATPATEPASPGESVAPVCFVRDLATWGDRVAVVGPKGALSYRELAARVEEAAAGLGPTRELVLLAAENSVEWLVSYLAALRGGHVVVLAPGDRPE